MGVIGPFARQVSQSGSARPSIDPLSFLYRAEEREQDPHPDDKVQRKEFTKPPNPFFLVKADSGPW